MVALLVMMAVAPVIISLPITCATNPPLLWMDVGATSYFPTSTLEGLGTPFYFFTFLRFTFHIRSYLIIYTRARGNEGLGGCGNPHF